jgi:hypothetical protein
MLMLKKMMSTKRTEKRKTVKFPIIKEAGQVTAAAFVSGFRDGAGEESPGSVEHDAG